MPLAVTHILLTIIVVDLYRDYVTTHKRYFTLHTILWAGIGGLLPDIDIPITWFFNALNISAPLIGHGGITHTLFFAVLFLIPAGLLWKRRHHQQATYFLVITFGIAFHLLLDCVLGGGAAEGVMLLWPLTIVTCKLHLLTNLSGNATAGLDAIILLAWLWHEEKKHKISDFM